MKKAIITITIGEHFQKIAKISHPLMKHYAEKIGADFISITETKISQPTLHWEKFQVLDYLFIYDRILLLDTDILIRKNSPNIFEIVPETHLGIYNEAPFVGRQVDSDEEKYYNTGVLVLSRCHRFLFRKPNTTLYDFTEQSYINLIIQKLKPQIFELDCRFNRMRCVENVDGKDRFEGFFIHYARINLSEGELTKFIADSKTIETLPDDHKAIKKIWIIVEGGLGDQVQAEPTIRFAVEHLWCGADIRVTTHFPELFSHLPVRCKKHGEKTWEDTDSEPFTRTTLPNQRAQQWKIVSNLLAHTVDFCSMAVMSRILPDMNKSYHLRVDPAALENVKSFLKQVNYNSCVLIHPGKHWESKSFPAEWWQSILDGILNSGLIPIIIGKDSASRGVIKLDGHNKAIDFTNLLSLKELIAIISLIPVLISNDSSPIHIAGAFDNWIILIPTCKHPDHVLPYRKGSKYYKTTSLYKKLALDDMLTSIAEVTSSTADKLQGSWEEYLPESDLVIKEIKKHIPII